MRKQRPRALKDAGPVQRSVKRSWRDTTVALNMESLPWGGTKAKRSPKDRSAVPGRVTKLPQVAIDRLAKVTRPDGPKRRLGSGQQDRGGMGTNLGIWLGLVILCLSLRLFPTSKTIEVEDMTDLNRASLIGRLGADPEIRNTQSGEKVASFRLATGERWKDKATGEKRERTEWHSVVVWGALAGLVEQYLTKGKRVMVEGQIRTRKWQDQSGADRYSTEIVLSGFDAKLIMLDGPQGGGGAAKGQDEAYGGGNTPGTGTGTSTSYGGGSSDMDDEIPF